MTLRTIKPDHRGYPGLTAIKTGETTELVVMGHGEKAEQILQAAMVARSAHNQDAGVSAASRRIQRTSKKRDAAITQE